MWFWFKHVAFALSCMPLVMQLVVRIEGIRAGHALSQHFTSRSEELLHMYDAVRPSTKVRSLLPKLSSNTYEKDVVSNYMHKGNISGEAHPPRENATIVMLVRNMELEGALESMRSLEDHFNREYHYDFTFLNDVPFTEEFKRATTAMASGKTQYGLIPEEDWNRPDWIDEDKFARCMKKMVDEEVMYGDSTSYRNMCRFNSGYFFRQKLLDAYDYYLRIEPDVAYYCDFPYDPFKVLRQRKAKYGFVISMYEYENTIPTLWDAVEEFIATDASVHNDVNSYNFLTDKSLIGRLAPIVPSTSDYNLCHFWSNFEVGDLNFFRSDEYLRYFDHLDKKGGFHYERWGDAPVHSIGAALLLKREEIVHFDQISYYHPPFMTCPTAHDARLDQRCLCNMTDPFNIDVSPNSCLMRWWKNGSGKFFIREDRET
ncbi:mannosyltransferase [Maudiozyma humilis]|uniref:Mannosyltransferase n=1 Tax=Maudiozyma humilis TaxID=51915 RepID=A0AAV5S421_MAUHU|nr:mannosyltransferase [Kazachstania humilis]